MRVLVVGAGAVGGCVAARLVRAGAELEVFDANPEHVALLGDPGLVIDGLGSGETTPIVATTNVDDVADPDLVLLAVRSHATTDACEAIAHVLGPRTDLVSLQNGLNEDRIASIVGAERTIGCVVGFGATWLEPGRVSLDATGDLTIGRLDGSNDERLDRARELLDLAFPTQTTANVVGALWAKMLVNSMTVLGALGGMLTGELLSTPERRRLVADVVAEGVRVARAEGVTLPDVFGLVPADAVDDVERWHDTMERVLVRVGENFGAIKSVTWRDFELGRPTEIDAVTGEIVRRGRANHTQTPLASSAYDALKEIEAGKRKPTPDNLRALISLASSDDASR